MGGVCKSCTDAKHKEGGEECAFTRVAAKLLHRWKPGKPRRMPSSSSRNERPRWWDLKPSADPEHSIFESTTPYCFVAVVSCCGRCGRRIGQCSTCSILPMSAVRILHSMFCGLHTNVFVIVVFEPQGLASFRLQLYLIVALSTAKECLQTWIPGELYTFLTVIVCPVIPSAFVMESIS
ncbi:hypothetical protein Tcan_07978 [Toxocara canis]|uniref:Uncharacterized protein n=1 Tax=Toxocara canis TaxID=6265 RepID=A0A0B2V225_TOXCA|nr:hypothetical protein Tcan_07978 [Toxocara canis]